MKRRFKKKVLRKPEERETNGRTRTHAKRISVRISTDPNNSKEKSCIGRRMTWLVNEKVPRKEMKKEISLFKMDHYHTDDNYIAEEVDMIEPAVNDH